MTFACSDIDTQTDRLDKIMKQAGENAQELSVVLKHFPDSSPQQKSAIFLISNMIGHYSLNGGQREKYVRYFEAFGRSNSNAKFVKDSLEKIYGVFSTYSLKPESDLSCVKNRFLIKEIKDAVRIWQKYPWSRKISQMNFLDYLLPYRLEYEALDENWHGNINNELSPVLDSLKKIGISDPLEVTKEVMRWWDAPAFKWTSQLPSGPNVGPSLRNFRCGTCKETADAIVYLLRGAGVASAVDFDIMRGDANVPHMWSVAFNHSGNAYAFTSDYKNWLPTNKYPLITSKVYRRTFSRRDFGDASSNDVPPRFINAAMIDVTSEYGLTYTFDVALSASNGNKHGLLCNSSHTFWEPVAIEKIKNNRIAFRHVRAGAVNIVMCLENGKLVSKTPPFIVKNSKSIRFFVPQNRWRDAEIFCKYPLSPKNGDIVNRVIGGRIEGCNRRDFVKAKTLYTIKDFPKRKLNEVRLPDDMPAYRYYRYIGADGSYCNIAEVMLLDEYDINIAVSGKVYGPQNVVYKDTARDYRSVFDGDWFSSYDFPAPSGGWSAVDLEIPRKIKKIIYAPRNRDNYVRPENKYELFYWNVKKGRWVSLGQQETHSDVLTYRVPEGALLYLKNHTSGRDERIFEYDFLNKVQIFY